MTLALALLVTAACSAPSEPYASLRQSTIQAVPGTFGYELAPVEGAVRPIDPGAAYESLPGAGDGGQVALTLAMVSSDTEGASWGPAWIYFTWDLCYFTAKGDFVSPSRVGLEDGCTPENVLVQVVEAETGDQVAAFDAFDVGGDWLPERVGAPDQVAASTRFH